jgi:hypothetical protein
VGLGLINVVLQWVRGAPHFTWVGWCKIHVFADSAAAAALCIHNQDAPLADVCSLMSFKFWVIIHLCSDPAVAISVFRCCATRITLVMPIVFTPVQLDVVCKSLVTQPCLHA